VTKTLVTYRTTDTPYNQYAVVPTIWVSDLTEWLTLSETAEIIGVSHNCDDGLIIPTDWPNYEVCRYQAQVSDLMKLGR